MEAKYFSLIRELRAIEDRTGLYLSDGNVDRENVDPSLVPESDEFYANMMQCAMNAAGMRAEEAGFDINELIGRSIY
jgi:hypothetical protein